MNKEDMKIGLINAVSQCAFNKIICKISRLMTNKFREIEKSFNI